MNEATVALTVMSGLIFLIFAGFLIWGLCSGQFRTIEEAKYRMFVDHDSREVKPENSLGGGGERDE